jgi:general L-amino acid transport system substrate-binding protein
MKFAAVLFAVFLSQTAFAQSTFDAVKAKGFVQCGVNTGVPGFSAPDSKGAWRGIDVDVCRAVAAAVLGDHTKVRYTPLTAQQRFTALQSGEVDILSRNTTWTITRDTSLGLNFVGVNYYDGQGFMVSKKLNVKSAKELNGATVCVQPGTTTELNLADYFRANRMTFKPVVIEKLEEVLNAYFAGRCDVFTTDHSGLISLRASRAPNPADHVILPEIISKEPLGPAVRHGDQNPSIQRFVGTTGDIGKMLGVDNRWALNIVKQVGNYGESFDANLKELGFERGLNRLWNQGGIMYAPPIR